MIVPMNTGAQQRVVNTPTVSFSTLAKVMGPLSLLALATRLRGHKYPSDGPRRSYQNALYQAVECLVNGAPLDPSAANLRLHEREGVAALAAMGLGVPRGYNASRASSRVGTWNLNGVHVSMVPDVELTSPNGRGAAKFSFTKDRLSRGVGSTMAALLWYHRSQVLGLANITPSACIVYEPRACASYRPGANPQGQVQQAQLACQVITTLWASL